MSRVDYSISDNTKLFVRCNLQREVQLFRSPVVVGSHATAVPHDQGKNRSFGYASLTHVFDTSMTNEFVFGYVHRLPERISGSRGGPRRSATLRGLTRTASPSFPV